MGGIPYPSITHPGWGGVGDTIHLKQCPATRPVAWHEAPARKTLPPKIGKIDEIAILGEPLLFFLIDRRFQFEVGCYDLDKVF